MRIPQMLDGMFGVNSVAFSWVMHLMIGLVLGLIYAYGLAPRIDGATVAQRDAVRRWAFTQYSGASDDLICSGRGSPPMLLGLPRRITRNQGVSI